MCVGGGQGVAITVNCIQGNRLCCVCVGWGGYVKWMEKQQCACGVVPMEFNYQHIHLDISGCGFKI